MILRELGELFANGKFPQGPSLKIDDVPFVNDNGSISNLWLGQINSVALITSIPNSIRANHYHKTDWHVFYVLDGTIDYYERPVGSNVQPAHYVFSSGDFFFTGPMVEHALFFPNKTTFLTFARNIRDHESHEADVVRVNLIKYQDGKILFGEK